MLSSFVLSDSVASGSKTTAFRSRQSCLPAWILRDGGGEKLARSRDRWALAALVSYERTGLAPQNLERNSRRLVCTFCGGDEDVGPGGERLAVEASGEVEAVVSG